MNAVHYSSKTVEWSTPQALFDKLDAEFGFTLDVCANPDNAKCATHFTAADDALAKDWHPHVCWMNPPYGYDIGRWTQKAKMASWYGALVVGLLPAKTETAWWHDDVLWAHEIRFYRGRIRFGGCNVNAPFPSAVVVWRPGTREPKTVVRWYAPSKAERGVLSVTP